MADNEGRAEATTHADLYHRHDADPSKWDEATAVTGRPVDDVPENSTFASRSKAKPAVKQVDKDEDEVEDKKVSAASKKAPAKKAAAKS